MMGKKENLNQEYARLMKDLKETPADYSLLEKVKRKARSLLRMEPKGRVVTKKRYELEKRLDQIEKDMLRSPPKDSK